MTVAPPAVRTARRERHVPRQDRPATIPELVLAHFLRGEEVAAEHAARLAFDNDHSQSELYETLRDGVYLSQAEDNEADALRLCTLDEQLVQLATRLEPSPNRRREPEAIVFSTQRRGVAAAISHMLRTQDIPAVMLALAELNAHRRGASAIARQFSRVEHIVVDAAAAQCEELLYFAAMLQHLHLIGDRFNVVVLGDDASATKAASLHKIAGLAFVSELSEIMAAFGVPTASPLTTRERAVLEFVSEGATNQQTATALGISIGTVKTSLARAQVKLKSCDRASAVATAMRRGWI